MSDYVRTDIQMMWITTFNRTLSLRQPSRHEDRGSRISKDDIIYSIIRTFNSLWDRYEYAADFECKKEVEAILGNILADYFSLRGEELRG